MDARISAKVKKGASWVILERLILRGLAFIKTPILAYFLLPYDFGLISIVTTVMFIVDVFTRTGFEIALIQKQENIDEYLDVAWTINFFKGIVEMVILWVLLNPVAVFYKEPSLLYLFMLLSATTVMGGLESPKKVQYYRTLNMKTLSQFSVVLELLSLIFTTLLAFWLRNVWALAWGLVIHGMMQLIGTYVIAPHHPRIALDKRKIHELWRFGKWEFLSGALLAAFMHADDLFVGKVLGLTALGYYSMAYKIGNIVTTELVDALRRVFFPAFSIIQNDLERLKKAYLSTYRITSLMGGVFVVGLSLLAPQFVRLLLGEKWISLIPALQILAIWGGVQMLSTSTAPLFRSIGRPDWFAKVQGVKLAFLVVLIYPFSVTWNIVGTSIAVLLAAALEIPFGIYWTRQALKCKYRDIINPLFIPISAAVLVALEYSWLCNFVKLDDWLHLIIFAPVIFVSYFMIVYLLDHYSDRELWRIFRGLVLKR